MGHVDKDYHWDNDAFYLLLAVAPLVHLALRGNPTLYAHACSFLLTERSLCTLTRAATQCFGHASRSSVTLTAIAGLSPFSICVCAILLPLTDICKVQMGGYGTKLGIKIQQTYFSKKNRAAYVTFFPQKTNFMPRTGAPRDGSGQ